LFNDYAYFGQVFRWGPSQINEMNWKDRKELLEAHKSAVRELENGRK